MLRIIFIILFFGSVLPLEANTPQVYLEKIRANYQDLKSFKALLDYRVYKGDNGTEAIESYRSEFYGNGKDTYRKMGEDILIVSKDNMMMTLTKSTKTIVLSNPSLVNFEQVDLQEAIKECQALTVEVKGENRVVHLSFKSGQTIPYTKLSIEVDKHFLIKKIVMSYAKKINFSKSFQEKDMDFPRLEIRYSSFSKRWKDSQKIIDLNPYIIFDNDGYKTTEKYKNYELIDLRLAK